jgi:hypothetical protein
MGCLLKDVQKSWYRKSRPIYKNWFKYFSHKSLAVLRSEAFAEAKVDKIFSGCQPCQLVKTYRYLRDHLRPHHQRLMCQITDNSGTISVLIITVWCIKLSTFQGPPPSPSSASDLSHRVLMMGTKMVPETSVLLNQSTRLVSRDIIKSVAIFINVFWVLSLSV